MSNKMEWERINDETIDFLDLFYSLLKKWKWMILCGMIFSVLLGAYKYNQYLHPIVSDYVKQAQKVELTSAEEQTVQNAKNSLDNILRIQDYKDKSIYININPNQVNTVTLFYEVSDTGKKSKRQMVESYLSYVNNGGVAKYIQGQSVEYQDLGTAYLSELISATKSATKEENQTLVLEEGAVEFSWFYIKVLGNDVEQAKKLADYVQDALEKYSLEANERVAKHHLNLLDEQAAEIRDEELANSLNDYNTRLSDSKYRIESLTSGFSESQNVVYNAYLQEKGLVIEAEKDVTPFQVLLFGIIGLVAGIFLYSCIYGFYYLYSGTVKSVRELNGKYTFRVFGVFYLKEGKKIEYGTKAQDKLVQKIEMLCEDKGIKEIGIFPVFALDESAGKKARELQGKLKERGISSKLVEGICEQPEQWSEVRRIGCAVPVFDMGHTTYREINEEMSFCQENQIEVLGVIAIER